MTAPLMVIFDRQHAGKVGRGPGEARSEDLGALMRGSTRDTMEADLTPFYIAAARAHLESAGTAVRIIDPLTDGPRLSYGARQERAKWWAKQHPDHELVYLACHLNAGGGDYAITGHDPRSASGRAVAQFIALQLATLPPVSRSRVEALRDAWARGLPCIEGVYSGPGNVRGVLLEPLFVDHREHVKFIEAGGLTQVGNAIADGLLAWAATL